MLEAKYSKEELKNAWTSFIKILVNVDVDWSVDDDRVISNTLQVMHEILKSNGVYV